HKCVNFTKHLLHRNELKRRDKSYRCNTGASDVVALRTQPPVTSVAVLKKRLVLRMTIATIFAEKFGPKCADFSLFRLHRRSDVTNSSAGGQLKIGKSRCGSVRYTPSKAQAC